jgi:disulfide oxidoreductase YuzD
MPLFEINRVPVSLTWKQDKQLRSEIYGSENVFGSYIHSSGVKDNTYKLQKKLLTRKYRDDKELFLKEYASLDLQGEEESDNLWDLLYDYCAY